MTNGKARAGVSGGLGLPGGGWGMERLGEGAKNDVAGRWGVLSAQGKP